MALGGACLKLSFDRGLAAVLVWANAANAIVKLLLSYYSCYSIRHSPFPFAVRTERALAAASTRGAAKWETAMMTDRVTEG